MLEVNSPLEMKDYVGKELGISDWVLIDQDRINRFADATDDRQWIHLDSERAAKELPTKSTIAHGYLTMSLIAGLPVFKINNTTNMINYGVNRLRFTNMVPVGSKVRLRQKLVGVEEKAGGLLITNECVMEIEGQERPAMIAETLSLIFNT